MGKGEEHTMKGCDEYSITIQLYLDQELCDRDIETFVAHLERCDDCRMDLEAEENLSALLRRSRPLYSATETLRANVIEAVQASPSMATRMRVSKWVAVAAAILLVAAGVLVPALNTQANAASYIDTAIAAHRSLLDGRLPLEVQSESPSVITAWFAGKVPFTFRLPTSAENLDEQPLYRLAGGRLVNYKGHYAALVAYQMQQQKISLLISPSSSAMAGGGEDIATGGVIFHYSTHAHLNVITWSTHGLTYALVSSLPGSGRESCMVCHQSMADGAPFDSRR
jgi:anti-sigma factor (TIGR02949 family)